MLYLRSTDTLPFYHIKVFLGLHSYKYQFILAVTAKRSFTKFATTFNSFDVPCAEFFAFIEYVNGLFKVNDILNKRRAP